MTIQAYHDDNGRLCLFRELPAGNDPPTELVLFAEGVNETTKGDLVFDDIGSKLASEAYSDKGQELLPFDYDHGMLGFITLPDSSKAAGWFRPGFEGDLTANEIEWTPAAAEAIRNREFRYFSPAVQLATMGDNEDGPMRVVKLINVAITNLPATKGQKPMVASETKTMPGPGRNEDSDEMSTELLKLLGAETEAGAITLLSHMLQLHGALFEELGVNGIDEIQGAVKKLKEQADQAATLASKVTELENELSTSKLEGLITQLHDEGKLAEAAFGWARTLSYEQLEQHGKLTQPDPKKRSAHDPADGDNETVTLTDAQKQAAKLQGFTEEEYIEAVKADAAAEAELRNGNTTSFRRAD